MAPTYDPNTTITLAETCIEFPEEGLSTPAQVVLRLSPVPDIRFEVSVSSPAIHCVLTNGLLKNKPMSIRLPTGKQIEVMPYGRSLVPVDSIVTGRDTGEDICAVQFGLINFRSQVSRTVQLTGEPWLVEIRAVDNHKKVRNSLSEQGGFGLTHWGSIRRSDCKSFSTESVQSIIEALSLFVSFAHGVYCGMAILTGDNQAGSHVWEQWSVSNVEPWGPRRSWFDVRKGEMLENAFPGFWTQYQGWQRNDRTRVALEWYLDSNAQKALHSSIVLTQAALERLSFVQAGKKLTAKQLCRKRGEKEGEWIARALSQVGINDKSPPSCDALEQSRIAKSGPHTLVKIRNDLIHQKMSCDILSNDVYRQARELGLWYVEMLLLKLFDYNGPYANRLRCGQVECVPWAPTSAASL